MMKSYKILFVLALCILSIASQDEEFGNHSVEEPVSDEPYLESNDDPTEELSNLDGYGSEFILESENEISHSSPYSSENLPDITTTTPISNEELPPAENLVTSDPVSSTLFEFEIVEEPVTEYEKPKVTFIIEPYTGSVENEETNVGSENLSDDYHVISENESSQNPVVDTTAKPEVTEPLSSTVESINFEVSVETSPDVTHVESSSQSPSEPIVIEENESSTSVESVSEQSSTTLQQPSTGPTLKPAELIFWTEVPTEGEVTDLPVEDPNINDETSDVSNDLSSEGSTQPDQLETNTNPPDFNENTQSSQTDEISSTESPAEPSVEDTDTPIESTKSSSEEDLNTSSDSNIDSTSSESSTTAELESYSSETTAIPEVTTLSESPTTTTIFQEVTSTEESTTPTQSSTTFVPRPTTTYTIPYHPFVNEKCRDLECEFGYKTDLYGQALCSCYNPCVERKCGRGVCKILKTVDNRFYGECFALQEITRPSKCYLKSESGNCKDYTSRFYWDSYKHRCVHFIYGGCKGNENNFETKEQCQAECNTCTLPAVKGPCLGSVIRYHFDSSRNACIPFSYGGCKGNENNFATKKQCENACILRRTRRESAFKYPRLKRRVLNFAL